jgi:hypothetical protein
VKNDSIRRREQIAYIRGRIDKTRELRLREVQAELHEEIDLFANRFAIDAVELKSIMGSVSLDATPDHVRDTGLPAPAAGRVRQAVAEVEVAGKTQGRRTQQPVPGEVAANPNKARYAAMTKKQRRAEMITKLKKRTDPTAKKILKGMLSKKRATKQNIYVARHLAKKRGEPLPPLPGEGVPSAA